MFIKRYESAGSDKIPTVLIQAGGETLRSEIHKPDYFYLE
jgi:hypothetical protein